MRVALAWAGLVLGVTQASGMVVAQYDFGTSSAALNLNSSDTDVDSVAGPFSATGYTLVNSSVGNPARSPSISLSQVDASLNTAKYLSFGVRPVTGKQLNLINIAFDYHVSVMTSAIHDTTYVLRSEADQFAADIASVKFAWGVNSAFASTGPISLAASQFQNLPASDEFEFRVYLIDGGSNSASVNARIDNITLNGTVVPEPSLMCLGGIGALLLMRRTRA